MSNNWLSLYIFRDTLYGNKKAIEFSLSTCNVKCCFHCLCVTLTIKYCICFLFCLLYLCVFWIYLCCHHLIIYNLILLGSSLCKRDLTLVRAKLISTITKIRNKNELLFTLKKSYHHKKNGGNHEPTNHLFLMCNIFRSFCHLVHSWFDISLVDSSEIADHFVQFAILTCFTKSQRTITHLVWFFCTLVIWKNWNDIIFNNKESSNYHLLDKIKVFSY